MMQDLTKIVIDLNPRPDIAPGLTQIVATLHVKGKKYHWPALHDSGPHGPGQFTDDVPKALPGFIDTLIKTIL